MAFTQFVLQVVFALNYFPSSLFCEQLPSLYWNSSNYLFTKETLRFARIRDTLDIHCPLFNATMNKSVPEYSIIYMVSKFGYDNCLLDDEKPVGQCLNPFKETIIKMTFREYTPMPNGLEFRTGQTYYFISTSNGTESGSHNRIGGLCSKKNLKIEFHIKEKKIKSVSTNAPTTSEKTTISPKFRHVSEKMRTADNNNLWHRSSSLETKKDSWSDNGIQAIVDIDAKTLIDSRVAKSLIAPYDKVNSQQKSAYNVQQLILYEIHETSDFDAQASHYYSKASSNDNHIKKLFFVISAFLWIMKHIFEREIIYL